MSKRENEAVVNRFLLSTLFLVILEFGFYILNIIFFSSSAFKYYTPLTYALIVIGILGIIAMIVLCSLKKIKVQNMVYYSVIFLIILITGLFVKFYYILPFGLNMMFINVATRLKAVGALVAILYLYEIIRYFLYVNK